MKAMFMSDLQVAKKYLIQQLVIAVLIGAFICFMTENLYVAAPMLAVFIPFSLAFTIIAFDERGDWQQFRLALPMSRTDVIVGRYASLALLAVIGLVIGYAVTLIVVAAAELLPTIPQLANLMVNFSWQAVLFSGVIGLVLILVMLAIIMPLVSRFGMTKTVRYLPVVIMIGAMLLFNALSQFEIPQFLLNFITWVKTPEGTIALAVIAAAIVVVLYAASAALSVKLYAKREL